MNTLPVHSQSWESWAKPVSARDTSKGTVVKAKNSSKLYRSALKAYQRDVSPRQGPKCPASPSCSSFTLQAMDNYGFLKGFIMGLDRIYFRENFDMKYLKHYLPVYLQGSIVKVYDPVEANDIFRKKDWTLIDPYFSPGSNSR